ncbi:hypothetical protein HYZ98_02240 [Candidatus Peregrinibacteria bacterium]|nr:hypothetical protein [Candidatus Peregrinibacteria bacterium]
MLDVLKQVELELPELLKDESAWVGKDVNYHPPRVERLWRQWRDIYRIYLHRIHPCKPEEALFHPHPWPSAMLLLPGSAPYKMGVGHGGGDDNPPIDKVLTMQPGSRYEMVDLNDWHFVAPIDEPAITLMVTGEPWSREAPKSTKSLEPLTEQARAEIFTLFRQQFCPSISNVDR